MGFHIVAVQTKTLTAVRQHRCPSYVSFCLLKEFSSITFIFSRDLDERKRLCLLTQQMSCAEISPPTHINVFGFTKDIIWQHYVSLLHNSLQNLSQCKLAVCEIWFWETLSLRRLPECSEQQLLSLFITTKKKLFFIPGCFLFLFLKTFFLPWKSVTWASLVT